MFTSQTIKHYLPNIHNSVLYSFLINEIYTSIISETSLIFAVSFAIRSIQQTLAVQYYHWSYYNICRNKYTSHFLLRHMSHCWLQFSQGFFLSLYRFLLYTNYHSLEISISCMFLGRYIFVIYTVNYRFNFLGVCLFLHNHALIVFFIIYSFLSQIFCHLQKSPNRIIRTKLFV